MTGSPHRTIPPFLSYGFRPMFLSATGWAIVALGLWLAMYFGNLRFPTRFDPISWHIHEMLFGFVLAAVAGFLLTAIPNWTGRVPVRGARLATLVVLWLFGRIDCLISSDLPGWLAVSVDVSFPVVLLAAAAREIIAARNWRNLPVILPLSVFVAADVLMHLESLGWSVSAGLGWRLALAPPVVLISLIGGRIVPNFTRNWLVARKSPICPVPANRFDTVCVGVLALAFAVWAFAPNNRIAGALLIAAASLNAVRLSRWSGLASWPEPLLFILHVGYLWLVVGTALLGFSVFTTVVPTASAMHALTAGAITVMILAVMPRVTLGHTGRALTAGPITDLVFVLINVAAVARILASWSASLMNTLLIVAGCLWTAAFVFFIVIYGPMLVTRRATPQASH